MNEKSAQAQGQSVPELHKPIHFMEDPEFNIFDIETMLTVPKEGHTLWKYPSDPVKQHKINHEYASEGTSKLIRPMFTTHTPQDLKNIEDYTQATHVILEDMQATEKDPVSNVKDLDLLRQLTAKIAMRAGLDKGKSRKLLARDRLLLYHDPSLQISNISAGKTNIFNLGATRPEDLPGMALPVLEFMEQVQPHVIIACDRGARLFGLAMHAAWRQTRDGQPFPTLDSKLHFARVSKTEDESVLQEKVDAIIESSKRLGEQRGNVMDEGEQLRVMFVDDWVIGGGTKRLTERLMRKHNAQSYFTVMCGQGADATGSYSRNTIVSWHDEPEEIGVNYLSSFQAETSGNIAQNQTVIAVRAVQAMRNRRKIQRAAQELPVLQATADVA